MALDLIDAGQRFASARQFIVTVAGIDGTWQRKTGGGRSAEARRERDGGSKRAEVMTDPAEDGDLTVSRGYKPDRDGPMLKRIRPLVDSWRTSITVQPTDRDLVPRGAPTVYVGILTACNDPDADSNSGDTARVELTFAIEDVA